MKFFSEKKIKLIVIDIVIFFIAYIISMFIRFQLDLSEMKKFLFPIIIFPFIMSIIFYIIGVYKHVWRFATLKELGTIFYAGIIGFLVNFIFFEILNRYITSFFILPLTVSSLTTLLGVFLIVLSRIYWYNKNNTYYKNNKNSISSNRILIIGTDNESLQILNEIETNPEKGNVVGFLDDDLESLGRYIRGYRVLGRIKNINEYVQDMNINEVIITLKNMNSEKIKSIISKLDTKKIKIKILPSFIEVLDNKLSLGYLREVDITDILGRKEVKINMEQIKNNIIDKNILVTGAGGSIGSELCRQIANFNPKTLFLLGRGENSIYNISNELKTIFKNMNIIEIICDVTDEKRLKNIFDKFNFDIIFHAAAHKHVPLMEKNPSESFRVNVIGTYNIAKLCIENQVEKFVLISTDKAIKPMNYMGASKRLAEILIKEISKKINNKTDFGIVRFGNVLGSKGSVIPLFKKQIKSGGPITITHPEMKRYFMTIPEAVALVMQCGVYAKNSEVFVLDMGKQIRILDLAKEMISLSGYIPEQDIKIVYTGIRHGEKLSEELFLDTEEFIKTENNRIYIASKNKEDEIEDLEKFINNLKNDIYNNDIEGINKIIKSLIDDSYLDLNYKSYY